MEDFLNYLIKNLITNEDELTIDSSEDEFAITYTIHVNQEELGKIIGKKGKTITAIRNICNLYQHKNDPDNKKRVFIKVAEEVVQ